MYFLLSRTQAGPGRTVKQEQEEISRNHIQTFIYLSVLRCTFVFRPLLSYTFPPPLCGKFKNLFSSETILPPILPFPTEERICHRVLTPRIKSARRFLTSPRRPKWSIEKECRSLSVGGRWNNAWIEVRSRGIKTGFYSLTNIDGA